jgi:hypothetical protein
MSAYLFHRFDLTDDFATYNQAFSQIWHGHLNPVDTVHAPSFPFWQNHFELAMWPLSLLSFLWPHALWMLWLQDLAIVAAEAVAALWVLRYLAPLGHRRAEVFGAMAFVLLITNAWWYEAASFDVHLEVLAIPFVLYAAYSLWSGSTTRAFVAVGLALLFGDVVATYVVLVGVAAMVSPRVRRQGRLPAAAVVVAMGIVWFVVALLLHANQGSGITTNYGYLVSSAPQTSSWHVLGHVLLEPGRVTKEVFDQWRNLGHLLASSGILGVLSPWGFFMFFGVGGPSALNVDKIFITPQIAFQTLVIIPFMVVGTVGFLLFVAGFVNPSGARDNAGGGGRHRHRHRAGTTKADAQAPGGGHPATASQQIRRRAAVAAGAVVLVVALVQNIPLISQLRSEWWRVDPGTAATLQNALPRVPANAEVIASQGVIGRFAGRTYVYPLLVAPQVFPVHPGRPVVFVIVPTAGAETVPTAAAEQDIRSATAHPDTHVLAQGPGAVVIEWHPTKGATEVGLP